MTLEGTPESTAGDDAKTSSKLKKEDFLSFKPTGRVINADDLTHEFALMASFFKAMPSTEDFRRIAANSGSHLVKLTTPRTDVSQAILRVGAFASNRPVPFAPSVNASDIPVAKIVFRPIEILGRAPKSVVDHLREKDEFSDSFLDAFVSVFGDECLDALEEAIQGVGRKITSLPATGEFPIIYLPRHGGGDIQATPVSPVETYMGFKDMSSAWFLKQEKDKPKPARGRWTKNTISSKPQNISGAIGGPRQRFMAEMPSVMRGYEAGILRYTMGGSFPFWYDDEIEASVLHYADRLGMEYTNSDIRAATDFYADKMIESALAFIDEVMADSREKLKEEGTADRALPLPPRPSALIMRRRWSKADREKALQAITSAHFRDRERIALKAFEN
jgi:hypothetical protein